MNRGKVLIAAPVHKILLDGLAHLGFSCSLHEQIRNAQAPQFIQDCVGVITSTRIQLNRTLLDAAPQLAFIGRMGSGMEVIDEEYAHEKNIFCCSSPEGNCNAVGEHALGMLLSIIRNIRVSNNEVVAGIWHREENRGIELEGKTVGIIGLGHTGRAFAKKLLGSDVKILAYDKKHITDVPAHVTFTDNMDLLYQHADIISFHVPLNEDTTYYFDEEMLQKFNKPIILINTSRGKVVKTTALYKGLKKGKIIGACLDVFETEPIMDADLEVHHLLNQMLEMPNVVITPHIAGYTHEALYKMSKVLLEKITTYVNEIN